MEQVSFNYRPGIHDFLRSRVLGQQEATDMVADAVERAMFGYFKAGAPIANFMFLGSTGVGKTETALSVAEFLWEGNANDHFIRLDMAEYQQSDSASVLIGRNRDEQGYLGEEIDRVNANGGGILLFDELEKAHSSVIKILLAILDVGRVTMTNGDTKSVEKFIVVMTSNLGTAEISDMRNTSQSGIIDMLQEIGRSVLSPEFFARIDDYLIFRKLSPEVQRQICDLLINAELKYLKNKLYAIDAVEREVTIAPAARQFILDNGYTDKLGARPLKKAVSRALGYAFTSHCKLWLDTDAPVGDLVVQRTNNDTFGLFFRDNQKANDALGAQVYVPKQTKIRA